MKFSYNWLKEITGIKESPEKLAELLTLRAFEVEGVEGVGKDWALDVKITPNRVADTSGHLGLAREIAALKKLRITNYELRITEDKKQRAADILKVKIENPEDCPRYTARVMDGIKIGHSPAWVRERLEVCGLQAINNVVDAANYVMLETGQPLHVFDFLKIENMQVQKFKSLKTIIVRRAKNGEKLSALDDKTYELNPEILVIADEKEPIAIAGVKGGKYSGVSDETRTIVLESANFDPVRIRAGSRTLNLRTDASYRFEHGLDPNQTTAAIDRLARFIQQLAGGTVLAGTVDAYPKRTKTAAILFRPEYAERLIGAKIPPAFYRDTFRRLGWAVKTKGRDFMVTPPTERRDIEIEEDAIEEIARLFDYTNVAPKMPRTPLASPEHHDEFFWGERMRDLLVGAGFTESELYQFTGERELAAFGLSSDGLVELENPTSPETKYLVPRVLIKYIASAAENLRNFDEVKLFGVQKSFPGKNAPERKDLVVTLAKKGTSGEEEFYQLRGVADLLLESMGISEHWYDDALESGIGNRESGIYHPYRVAEVKIGDEKIGVIGEIHPDILKNIKSKARIAAAEIDVAKITSLATAESEFRPIGKFPAIIRDIAVIVPSDVKTEEVQNIIENIGGELLADTDLFDYFQDEQMREQEEKSLAFHLVFQSPERTLTDAEIDAIVKKITAALEEKGWEVRK